MSIEPAIRANRAALMAAKEQGNVELIDAIVVGRDVLELVSSAMYIDPMTVYREYIQNAADAIDDARQRGMLLPGQAGKVTIDIDAASRSIRIRDNGTGASNHEFGRKMSALGASGKRGTTSRGFRGVGRLAGLAYAQEVIFRSRTVGDKMVAEMVWDCRKLKALFRSGDGDIESLIRSVATLRMKPAGGYPEHFFEVELRGIVRIRSDRLMSPAAIDDYLGQVGPVPFSPDFTFGRELRAALAPVVALGELEIFIDGSAKPVYRPHRDVLVQDGMKPISFDQVTINEVFGIDGDPAALVWILHHEYEGALPSATKVKGLRLRAGNVQIGDNNLLEELFSEQRFNAWSVGEIHVIDRKITPNGRRDHFEQNAHYTNLLNQLSPMAREIAKLCRTSSIKRKWLREADLHRQQIEHAIDVFHQGAIGAEEKTRLATRAEESFSRLKKALANNIFEKGEVDLQRRAMEDLRAKYDALQVPSLMPLELPHLDENERKAFTRFCDLVYQCSPNASSAKILIDKILTKISSA
ncbi:ATP-binding protein [Mesorhizobium sp. M2A.F.Ca.ET.067.02.1.1]|uniref:ATP-binding protein n=1 Tax=Mesorhizobium sp. M2A.F.Ca.ET.067.02.1.1 TaxID=2496749 RepID=UPI000FD552D7|nr:ATP-binding protein [Mesorhizobium sp. M2A.F.Ca.ET.067.02.1.1]RUW72393.1 molecular chaperone Hsp90 [Mesorhizobium sp. M2A.F.Ca.ET.067.02.1.1]TIU58362.1 MAG: molecular chaperone Hsp90 [Mesorhizobium sp.]